MAKSVASFILSFMILTKMWIFEFSLGVGSTELFSLATFGVLSV